jgi:hypothetical protein
VAEKFDGSKRRRVCGRPRVKVEVEGLVVRFARENSGWGYDRIVGALANLGYRVSDQTVGATSCAAWDRPCAREEPTTTWKDFLRRHMDVLAGTDFFTVELLVLVQTGRNQAMMAECNGLFRSKHCSRDAISTDRSSSCV